MVPKVLNLLPLLLVGVTMVMLSARAEYHCGRQQSCYMLPSNCSYGTCDYEVVWSMSEDGTKLNLKMAANTAGWVGVGFSNDRKMGGDHVLMCMKTGDSTARFEHRFNSGRSNIGPETNDGITVNEIKYSDGAVSCRLERAVNVTSGGELFDVSTTDYYMIFARGPMVNNVPVQHDQIPAVTSDKVDFSDILIVDAMNPHDEPPTADDDNGATVKQAGIVMVMSSMLMVLIGSNM